MEGRNEATTTAAATTATATATVGVCVRGYNRVRLINMHCVVTQEIIRESTVVYGYLPIFKQNIKFGFNVWQVNLK